MYEILETQGDAACTNPSQIAVILILPLLASSEVLDKSSSFSVEQDATTGEWTLLCESEVDGIDRSHTHNVSLGIRAGVYGVGAYDLVKIIGLEIGPDQHSYSEAVEGVFDLQFRKFGHKLKISISGYLPLARTGDSVGCSIHIGRAATAATPAEPLHWIVYDHDILNNGAPNPAP